MPASSRPAVEAGLPSGAAAPLSCGAADRRNLSGRRHCRGRRRRRWGGPRGGSRGIGRPLLRKRCMRGGCSRGLGRRRLIGSACGFGGSAVGGWGEDRRRRKRWCWTFWQSGGRFVLSFLSSFSQWPGYDADTKVPDVP